MAGASVPRARLTIIFCSKRKVSTIAQLPKIQHSFLPVHSRAFWFRSHTRTAQRSSTQLRFGERGKWQRQRECLFSTSVGRRGPEDGENQALKPTLGKEGEKPPPSTSTKPLPDLRSTIKTKVSALHHENIYNIPNLLTLSRLLATPAIGYLIIHNHPLYAFSLFAYAGFSDLLDGWIARKWKLQTVVGSVVDPMADKALMTTLVTCLAVNGSLPLPLATLILGRDVSLAIAAIYYRYASLPAPKTFTRYWDFSLPSAEVHPTTVSKLNTFLQLGLIGTTMCVSLLHDPSAMNSVAGGYLQSVQASLGGEHGVRMLVQGMSGVVATTTIWSGLSYAWMTDAVKILGENEDLKRKQGVRGRMIVGGCFGSVVLVAGWLAWREWDKEEEGGGEVFDKQ